MWNWSLGSVPADTNFYMFLLILAVFVVILYVIKTYRDIRIARDREQTKRELAAYVAEGSIRPEDATAILNAGSAAQPSSQAEQQIASAVAWGTVSPDKAATLIQALRRPSGAPDQPPSPARS